MFRYQGLQYVRRRKRKCLPWDDKNGKRCGKRIYKKRFSQKVPL